MNLQQPPQVDGPRFAGRHYADDAVERGALAARERVLKEITRLGLEQAMAELDLDGFTILSPDQTAPSSYVEKLRDAILVASGKAAGVPVDVVTGATHS